MPAQQPTTNSRRHSAKRTSPRPPLLDLPIPQPRLFPRPCLGARIAERPPASIPHARRRLRARLRKGNRACHAAMARFHGGRTQRRDTRMAARHPVGSQRLGQRAGKRHRRTAPGSRAAGKPQCRARRDGRRDGCHRGAGRHLLRPHGRHIPTARARRREEHPVERPEPAEWPRAGRNVAAHVPRVP